LSFSAEVVLRFVLTKASCDRRIQLQLRWRDDFGRVYSTRWVQPDRIWHPCSMNVAQLWTFQTKEVYETSVSSKTSKCKRGKCTNSIQIYPGPYSWSCHRFFYKFDSFSHIFSYFLIFSHILSLDWSLRLWSFREGWLEGTKCRSFMRER
jgi:hypothetical protein